MNAGRIDGAVTAFTKTAPISPKDEPLRSGSRLM
jgi:hypothetical protein